MASPPDRESKPKGRESADEPGPNWYALVGVGFEFALMVAVMTLIGWYLDRRWNCSPWLLIAGAAIGFAGGMWILIKAAVGAFKD